MKRKNRVIISAAVICIVCFLFLYSPYRNGWECKKFLWGMKLEGPDGLRLSSINFDREEENFSIWYDVPGEVSNNLGEILASKEVIEKLLSECCEIPKEFSILIGFATRGDTIMFSNSVSAEVDVTKEEPMRGGYQLSEVVIHVPCDLADLSVLKDVKYLYLLYGIEINGIKGLENMHGLLYIRLTGFPGKVTPDKTFTEDEIQEIKKMYPNCYIDCYPVDTY